MPSRSQMASCGLPCLQILLVLWALAGPGSVRAQRVGFTAPFLPGETPALRPLSESLLSAPVRLQTDLSVDVTHLSADVVPVDARGGLDVSLFLDVTVTGDTLKRLALPARALEIRRAEALAPSPVDTLDADSLSYRLDFVAVEDSVILFVDPMPRGRRVTFRLDYFVPVGEALRSSAEGTCCAWTTGIKNGGASWLPLPVDPPDRFTASIRVRSRGLQVPVTGGRRDATRPEYRFDRPVRADQIVLAVTGSDRQVRSTGQRVVVYYGAGRREAALTLFHRDLVAALDYMERASGQSLPSDTMRVVFAPSGSEGFDAPGIVGAGLLVAEPALLVDQTGRLSVDPIPSIARMAARLWVGAGLSVATWSDAWILQALADWMAVQYVESRLDEGAAAAVRAARLDAYLSEAERYRRPLVWDRWDHPADLLDAHGSVRGGGFLHWLEGLAGRGPFGSGIRRLFARRSQPDIDSEDLRQALESSTGRSLSDIFDAWVYGAGHPELAVESRFDLSTDRMHVSVRQTQEGPLVPSTFPLETDVRWMTLAGEGSAPLRTSDVEWTYSAVTGIEPRFVLVDADHRLVARIHGPADMTSLSAVARYGSIPSRLAAARALAQFADDPALPLALRLTLDQERNPAVRRALASTATRIPAGGSLEGLVRRMWSDSDPQIRTAAVHAARAFAKRPEWESFVRDEATRDSSAAVVAEAVSALAAMGSRDAGFIARSALVTPSYGEIVRAAGFTVLAQDSTMTEFERRQTILDHTATGLPAAEIVAALRLAPIHGPDRALRARMTDLLDRPSFVVRYAAAQAAAFLLRPADRPIVENRLAEETDPAVRRALESALRRLGEG